MARHAAQKPRPRPDESAAHIPRTLIVGTFRVGAGSEYMGVGWLRW